MSCQDSNPPEPLYRRQHTAAGRAEARAYRRAKRSHEAPGGGRLGNKRQSFGGKAPDKSKNTNKKRASSKSSLDSFRREVAADQFQATKLIRAWREQVIAEGGTRDDIAGNGVCFCGWHQIPKVRTKLMRVAKGKHWHAYFTGRQMCGLRWVCPICTAKRAEIDRQSVNDGMASVRKRKDVFAVMLTMTTRHKRSEDAHSVLMGVLSAEQGIKDLGAWRRLRRDILGYARVLEWTFGRNGHHPHFHTILLVEAESQAAAMAKVETLKAPYMGQLEKAGRDGTSASAWKRSFHVQDASAAENYITTWGAAEELTGAQKKEAAGEGLTPWQLLRLSRTAHATENRSAESERAKYGAIWREIVKVTQGRAQLFKDAGWNRLVAAYRAEQSEPPEPPIPEEVADFGARGKRMESSPRFLAARTKTIVLREAAEIGALDEARVEVERLLNQGQIDNEIFAEMRNRTDYDDDDDFVVIDDSDTGLRSCRASHRPPTPEMVGEKGPDEFSQSKIHPASEFTDAANCSAERRI